MITTVQVTATTHVGRVRAVNQDRLLVGSWMGGGARDFLHETFALGEAGLICAIADGLGGHAAGEIASTVVLESLAADRDVFAGAHGIRSALGRANASLYQRMAGAPEMTGMGSTIAALAMLPDQAWWFNVGDSRIYRIDDDGGLEQVSVDDRPDPEIDAFFGLIDGGLTAALGGCDQPDPLDPHVGCFLPQARSRWLICSDGLSEVVDADVMRACLQNDDHLAVGLLLRAALAAGAPDNISIVLLSLE